MTLEQIDRWRHDAEGERLEFKEAKQQMDFGKLCDYCVALANEGGGYLILGVSDRLPRQIVGTAAVSNCMGMMASILERVRFRVDIQEISHPEGRLVVLSIPSRPRGTAYSHEGRFLMRAGASLVPMSEDRLRTIFSEGDPGWLEAPIDGVLSAGEIVERLDTQRFFELIQQPYPVEQGRVLERLHQERLVATGAGGRYTISRLAALLLAKQLNSFPEVERKAPRVVVYQGKSKLNTKLDVLGTKGYAVGFQSLLRFVMGQLPQNEVIENALRSEVKLAPEIVFRETIANALIHQDLTMTGASVMIEVYDDRVEISSPGEPIVPANRFIDGYQSRNERLADLMRRFRICEEKGSGVDKVITAAENYQLPAPDFRAGLGRTSVVIAGPRNFDDMGRDDRVRACYQHASLRRVMHEFMTNQTLRRRFDLSEAKSPIVSQVISAAVGEGLIKPDETVGASRKFKRYLPFWA